LISILFGLSMDYQVFLVSRIHEEWAHKRDNDLAVARGQAATGRVITAAATTMILVFGSFALGSNVIIKQFGIGLAAAIFIDAFVVRTVLVPALMHLFGNANWWLPTGSTGPSPSSTSKAPPRPRPNPSLSPRLAKRQTKPSQGWRGERRTSSRCPGNAAGTDQTGSARPGSLLQIRRRRGRPC
jgi:MMPL family